MPKDKEPGLNFSYVFLAIWAILIASVLWAQASRMERIPYSQFLAELEKGKIEEVSITKDRIAGKIKDSQRGPARPFVTTRVEPELAKELSDRNVKFTGVVEDTFLRDLLSWVVPILLFLGIWGFFVGRMVEKEGGVGGGLMSIGKSRARIYMEEQIGVTFADVAGVDEAKEELKEVINFLKEPQRYARLGGRLPKGILLVGPPGTGKTLLARAVAGEAGVPFFSISGSEFVELFVGVGAARVRDLFEQAQKRAPCIIFIDELDALGRARGLNPLATHDEKEQTLNQLLVELDGFDPRQGVVLLAATNRPEILDAALLRAGRFDRHVLVDRPDKRGRVEILKVHLKGVTLDEDVDPDSLAGMTPGFTGADLANLVNEAALLAARRAAEKVAMADFTAAVERIIAGLEKKNRVLNPRERQVVAYHEMGHALVSLAIPGTDPIQKVSIIPRGIGALGYTMQRPTEDRFLMTRQELEDKMTVLLGGRAAESIVFGELSTGAADDLGKATDIARSMVTRFGMNEKLGPVTYEAEPPSFLHGAGIPAWTERRFSEETARDIDCAIKDLVEAAFQRAVNILRRNRAALEESARNLLAKETLTQDELPVLPDRTQIALGHPD
ncbi:MAG TPA: ATP-dependent zinc metalloprotease FtsH [Candidatus Obscuribacterales bacterium]